MVMEGLNETLRWCYRALLFALPIVAVIYLVSHAAELNVSAREINFLEHSYFLVVLFSLFFIVLYSLYLPTNLRDTLSLLLTPIFGCLVQFLFVRDQFWLYLAELGMVYTLQISLAFLGLLTIFVGVGIWNALVHKEWGDFLSMAALVALQMLFAIPCAGAVYLFGRVMFTVILPQALYGYSVWSLAGAAVYGFWLVMFAQNMWIFFKVLYNESIGDYSL